MSAARAPSDTPATVPLRGVDVAPDEVVNRPADGASDAEPNAPPSAPSDAPSSSPRGVDDASPIVAPGASLGAAPNAAAADDATTVLEALARALDRASRAERWDVVAVLARELEARRLEASGNVVPIGKRRGK